MDMHDVTDCAMQAANKKQVEEYYETTELISLEKYVADSGLGYVEIHPPTLEHALRKKENKVVTIQDIILTAMLDSANYKQLAEYYADMKSSKTVLSFLRESGAGKIEVNIMKFIRAMANLMEVRRDNNE